jgi:ABC-type transporter Mla subunit MlaD
MAPDGRLVEVTMSLDKTFKFTDDLGIKMNLLGLTGMKYLEMDTFRPEQQREEPALAFTPRNRVVPTYPSDMREIGTALDNVFQKVKALDVDQISNNLVRVTSRMDKALGELKLGRISYETIAAVKEVRETAKRVGDEVAKAQVAKHMTKSVEKATEFFEESAEAARSADRALRRADNNLNRLSQKLDRSADNILDFTRMIRQKPSSIFFGQEEKKEQKKP